MNDLSLDEPLPNLTPVSVQVLQTLDQIDYKQHKFRTRSKSHRVYDRDLTGS